MMAAFHPGDDYPRIRKNARKRLHREALAYIAFWREVKR